jgi:hypothetical protein
MQRITRTFLSAVCSVLALSQARSFAQNSCQARCPDGSMSEPIPCDGDVVPMCLRGNSGVSGNGGSDNSQFMQEQAQQRAAEQARQEQLKRDEEERERQAAEAQRLREQQQHDAFIK